MAAPVGNQFWKIRSKHGRDTIFSSPEKLWEAAAEFFEWCDKNPLIEIDFKGKDADRVELPRMRAYTLHGLCIYLGCNTQYFTQFKQSKTYAESEDFSVIVTCIEEIIYNQKYTGAAAGFLNPLMIAKDLGIKDRVDMTTNGESMNAPIIELSRQK